MTRRKVESSCRQAALAPTQPSPADNDKLAAGSTFENRFFCKVFDDMAVSFDAGWRRELVYLSATVEHQQTGLKYQKVWTRLKIKNDNVGVKTSAPLGGVGVEVFREQQKL